MKAIIVEDEPLMIKKFERLSKDIEDLNITGKFEDGKSALDFMRKCPADVAFVDIEMPVMDGITLAGKLKEIREDIIIVFISAYDRYLQDFNKVGADYYLMKPYTKEILEMVMEKLRLLNTGQRKDVHVQTFGRFVVRKNGRVLPITGKAKEILALIISRCGREISNEEIYYTVWEGRPYSNSKMTIYYNALRRLKDFLKSEGLENMIISTARGQMANTQVFDCDYYDWKEKNLKTGDRFEGEFLSEYSWAEIILAEILEEEYGLF